MSVTGERVPITISLPRDVIAQIDKIARLKNASVEHEVELLIQSGLRSQLSVQERLNRLSSIYRERIGSEGKMDQTPDEIMDELRAVREQIARECYPD